jgi:multicomponent Na+:H+ antiporter subunit E
MRSDTGILFFSLSATLFSFWLALSGHYTSTFITIGAISALLTATFCLRMSVVDEEGHPIHLVLRALTYWPWLLLEIAKSALNVTLIILNPRLPISPTMVKIKAQQKTGLGVSIFANSITLTPGTISVDVVGGEILVHALSKSGAEDLEEGAMNRRVVKFEGRT